MKTFVGLFFVFIFSYFHVLPANCQAMGGPPAGTLPPPCIVQVGQPPCTAAEIGNCWADISTGAAEPIFKICTTAGFVEIEKTIHDLPTTFKNTVTIDTTGTLTNNAITTLNGATTVAGATTLSGPTTTISSMTTDITGTANLTGPTIISGTTTLSGSTTTISSMTTDISSNTTHTGTTDFNNTVNLGAGIDFLVGSSGNLNFGANRLQNIDTPVLNDDAVRKDYVDTLGGGLAVNIVNANTFDFGDHLLQSVKDPVNPQDVATRAFVLAQVGSGGGDSTPLFVSTSNATVTATTFMTLIGSGVGSLTIPANSLAVGDVLVLRAKGFYTTDASAGNPEFAINLGNAIDITSPSIVLSSNISNGGWELEYFFTVRSIGASGTVQGQGKVELSEVSGTDNTSTTYRSRYMVTTGTQTIDTTSNQVAGLAVSWSTPESITCTNFVLEKLSL